MVIFNIWITRELSRKRTERKNMMGRKSFFLFFPFAALSLLYVFLSPLLKQLLYILVKQSARFNT